MSKVAIFIADGTEETEAITPLDILRRAGIEADLVSIKEGTNTITASRGVVITADKNIADIDIDSYDMLALPGGIAGTNNLKACKTLTDALIDFNAKGKGVAAICAAPTILSSLGILKGVRSTCNPGFWDTLASEGADLVKDEKAVISGNKITSQAMGTSVPFGLAMLEYLNGKEAALDMASKICF
ncbi:MAG: DJ-1/PfpI family protein [Saccharofermentans sp.]|nr:DJ-1/PfpI family protein [Saccharofermentans sp.]